VRTGTVPNGADFIFPVATEVWANPGVLFARSRTDGKAYALFAEGDGFAASWTALPPLVPDSALQVGSLPMSATEGGNLAITVAAYGADGRIYVTSQTGRGSHEFHPWQQIGEPAANAPGLISPNLGSVELAYRGQDGRFYHYTATAAPGDYRPLVFTGGGRT
jgi:hypothetical protein